MARTGNVPESRSSARAAGTAAVAATLVAALVAAALLFLARAPLSVERAAASRRGASGAPLAPDGTFLTARGTETVAALRGRPAMIWFVAGGCASCEASIPVVADHLGALTATGLQVVTLGLYGDFPSGRQGIADLLAFGHWAAGGDVLRPGWTWGLASRDLSLAYDPTGIPDLYVIVGPHGHIRYRNSVPASTLGDLLREARTIATAGSAARS